MDLEWLGAVGYGQGWERMGLGYVFNVKMCFSSGAVVKNPPANAGDSRDVGSIPGLRRSPGIGNGNPLQYSCLENPMYRGAWQATVHRVTKSQTRLSDWARRSHTQTIKWLRFLHFKYHTSKKASSKKFSCKEFQHWNLLRKTIYEIIVYFVIYFKFHIRTPVVYLTNMFWIHTTCQVLCKGVNKIDKVPALKGLIV